MTATLAQLDLLPKDGQGAAGQCHLGILQADDEIVLVEIPKPGGNSFDRGYPLKETKFIPCYPFRGQHPHNNSSGWPFTVVKAPIRPDVHDFATRKAALEFQKFVTGYVVRASCHDAVYDAMIRKGLRNRNYVGQGEIQLWLPVEKVQSPTGSCAGPSNEIEYPSGGPLSELVKVQTGASSRAGSNNMVPQPNGNRVYFSRDRSPLLVAFLRDSKERRKYTMMSTSILALVPKRDSDQAAFLAFQNDDGFEFKALDSDEDNLNTRFDVCGFARKSSRHVYEGKMVHLRISSPNQNHLQDFRKELQAHGMTYSGRRQDGAKFRDWIESNGSKSPTSSIMSFRDRRKSSSAASDKSFGALPKFIDGSGLFAKEVSEIFSDPAVVPGRYELPSAGYHRATLAGPASSSSPLGSAEATTGNSYSHDHTTSATIVVRPGSTETATTKRSLERRRPGTPKSTFTSTSGSTSTGNTCKTDDSPDVFSKLDNEIRRFTPDSTKSLAEETIRRLHSLPGEPRALLYEFSSMHTSSDGSPRHRRFRCPFDIVYPQNGTNTGCQGPGFYPLENLWNHLEKHHTSFDCYNCLGDFGNFQGIQTHFTKGCKTERNITTLPKRIPFAIMWPIKDALLGQTEENSHEIGHGLDGAESEEIKRWDAMWDILFPSPMPGGSNGKERERTRPSPFITPARLSHDGHVIFAKLEMVFAAMVESDTSAGAEHVAGEEMVSKTSAKRCLRAAVQALLGEELGQWETVLSHLQVVLPGDGSAAAGGQRD